ncbi:hypothetical protein BDZ89DRAFT_1146046, partial [Hymenopellis radicata]
MRRCGERTSTADWIPLFCGRYNDFQIRVHRAICDLNYRLATFEFLASGEIVEAGNDNLALKDLSIWHYTEFASFTGKSNASQAVKEQTSAESSYEQQSDADMDVDLVSDSQDSGDEDLVILGEDDAPLMAEGDLLRWLNADSINIHTSSAPKRRGPYHSTKLGKDMSVRRRQELAKAERKRVEHDQRMRLKPTIIKDFFQSKSNLTPSVINLVDSNDDSELNTEPIASTSSLEVPSSFIPSASRASSTVSSREGSVISSAASSVPASEFSLDDNEPADVDDDEDPLMAGLDEDGEDVIDDAPSNLMTSEDMDEEGLAAFSIDLIDELGLDELEDEENSQQYPRDPPQESAPSNRPSPSGPTMPTAARPSPKEWYIYADETFDLRAEEVGTGKASPLSVPTAKEVDDGISNLEAILRPRRKTGYGYKAPPPLGRVVLVRLGLMLQLLHLFKRSGLKRWIEQSLEVAEKCSSKGPSLARKIRRWASAFCKDQKNIPRSNSGAHNASILDKDEDLANDIHLHLQSLGKWVSADDVVHY